MKRLRVVLALAGLVASTACGSMGQVRLGSTPTVSPDQEIVEQLVCRGALVEAELYCERRGAPPAEVTERVERARKAVAGKPGCQCAAETCRAEKE